jgi:hypothetical protein
MGRRGMHIEYRWENQKERDHWDNKHVGVRVTLRWILGRKNEVIWTRLIWLKVGITEELL